MTPEQQQALLDGLAVEIRQRLDRAFEELLRRLRDGEPPREAIAAVTRGFEGDYQKTLAAAFSAVLGREIGVAAIRVLPIGGIALSERLYAHSREVSASARRLIEEHVQGFLQARTLALRLYEGYGFKIDPLKVRAALPKYLRQAMIDPGVNQSLTRVFARIRADTLKTPALKAAYLRAIDAAEQGAGAERLRKLLRMAWYERNRYFANRIAQTELHRAYSDQVARDLMADDGIHWVQVVMSRTHPVFDQCDLHARLDAYGRGPGVYPKEKAPKPTFHPFCRCILRQRPDLDAEPDAKPKPGAERNFLGSLPKDEARRIAGSRAKLDAILKGEDWERVIYGGNRPEYRLRRVGEVYASGAGATLAVVSNAYETARRGGKHKNLLRQCDGYGEAQLDKSIRSHRKNIAIHQDKMANPERYVPTWSKETDSYRAGLMRKWQREIDNFQEQILVIEGYKNERFKS